MTASNRALAPSLRAAADLLRVAAASFRLLGGGWLQQVVAEFRRASEAEQRYRQLRHLDPAALAREGLVPSDVPRRIFEEFYRVDAASAPIPAEPPSQP
jgi:hypothetical protein